MDTTSSESLGKFELRQSLRRHWGYDSFRANQELLCEALLRGQDCFWMTATGTGKSLTYQLPAIALNDVGVRACALVISPLVSLIEDQVLSLCRMGIPACAIGSQSTFELETLAMQGEFQLVYCTPEKISTWTNGLRQLAKATRLVCCAIDESHCIAEWGHCFRPSYRSIASIRDIIGTDVPIIALTASATRQIEGDIISNLRLRNPLRVRSSIDRPNLYLSAAERCSTVNDVVRAVVNHRQRQLLRMNVSPARFLRSDCPYESALVYATKRKITHEIALALSQCTQLNGLSVAFYHAGLTVVQRAQIHDAFLKNEVHVVVATTAFGMGINKPDIRLVVHCGLPLSIESYYQQCGRAGRDGQPARCLLLWNHSDELHCHNLLNSDAVVVNTSSCNDSSAARHPIESMKDYARGEYRCRRVRLLDYFDEDHSHLRVPIAGCCDLCDAALKISDAQSERKGTFSESAALDLSKDVYLLLRTVFDLGRVLFSSALLVSILLGKQDQQSIPHLNLFVFGRGKRHSEHWWKSLLHHLAETDNMFHVSIVKGANSAYRYRRYELTDRAISYLSGSSIASDVEAARASAPVEFDGSKHCYACDRLSTGLQRAIEQEQIAAEQSRQISESLKTVSGQKRSAVDEERKGSYVTFEAYQRRLQLDADAQRRRVYLQALLRRGQREMSTEHRVNVQFVLSHDHMNILLDALSPLTISPGEPRLTDMIMRSLEWKDWKLGYAKGFAARIHSFLCTESVNSVSLSTSVTTDEEDSAHTVPTTDASCAVLQRQQSISRPCELYRPDYLRTPLTDHMTAQSPLLQLPVSNTEETVVAPTSTECDENSEQNAASSANSDDRAHFGQSKRRRRLLSNISNLKARRP